MTADAQFGSFWLMTNDDVAAFHRRMFRDCKVGRTAALVRQKHLTSWSIAVSLLMILSGILAIGLPVAARIALNIVVAWLLVFYGVAHLVFGWHLRGIGGVLWQAP